MMVVMYGSDTRSNAAEIAKIKMIVKPNTRCNHEIANKQTIKKFLGTAPRRMLIVKNNDTIKTDDSGPKSCPRYKDDQNVKIQQDEPW